MPIRTNVLTSTLLLALLLALAACGDTPAPAASTTPAAPAEPTLTPAERAVVATWSTRTASMITAAKNLQALGQEIRADIAWKGRVQAQGAIITGGQQVIRDTPLPPRYGPLSTRATAAVDSCALIVRVLPSVDDLTIAALARQQQPLEACVTGLERVQLSLEGL